MPPPPAPAQASTFQVAPGAAPLETPQDYKARQQQYMVFKRQIDKDIPSPSIPVEFITAWKEAVGSRSRTAKNQLFQKWCEAGGNWGLTLGCTPTASHQILYDQHMIKIF